MLDSRILIGYPIDFKGICKIYPPTVQEVVTNSDFPAYVRLLTITQDELEYEFKKEKKEGTALTPIEFLLNCAFHDIQVKALAVEAFRFFIREKVTFAFEKKCVIIGDKEEELECLTEEDYFNFQNAIRAAIGTKPIKPPEPVDPNENPRITEMKRKARERDRIKAKQASKGGIQLSTSLVAICCMGIGITPLNIGELSYAAIGPIMDMMQEKEKYDIDIRSLLAGADSKKIKPKYWIRNSDKE